MIYAAPGATFETTVANADTGLTGTIGVRIIDGQGGTTVARATTGIIESPAGSGIYTATLTAPSVAGEYSVVWDDGGVGPLWATDQLTVTSTLPASAVPSGADLTTLSAVRDFLATPSTDQESDPVIQQLITRASRVIMRWAGREFAPATASAARVFTYQGGGFLDLGAYELRSATSVVLDSDQTSTITLTAGTDYLLRPTAAPDGVYQWLELPTYDSTLAQGRQVTITGAWGWPAVPADIEHACIITVATWLRRDVSAFSRTFNLDEGRTERPDALPAAAAAALRPYRVPVIA